MILHSTHRKISPPQFTMFLLNLGRIPDYGFCLNMNWRGNYSRRTAIYDFITVFSARTRVQQYHTPSCVLRGWAAGLGAGQEFSGSSSCGTVEQLLPLSLCSWVQSRAASAFSQQSKLPALTLFQSRSHSVGPENSQILTFFKKKLKNDALFLLNEDGGSWVLLEAVSVSKYFMVRLCFLNC